MRFVQRENGWCKFSEALSKVGFELPCRIK